nr:uncharacterized protein K02A2.6-like [Halyomorpha halys]
MARILNEEDGPNLLGRNWFKPLGITIEEIKTVQLEPSNYNSDILKIFLTLTLKTLEGHSGTPIHIEIKEGASSKFCKARRVPYVFKGSAISAIQWMVNQKMLTTSGRPVGLGNSCLFRCEVRAVGVYKNTVNPPIKDSEYPLPSVAEALATLNGGVIFSQIDLQDTYKQLEVDEDTAKLLTISTPIGLFEVLRLSDRVLSFAHRIFQKLIESRLQGIPGVLVYLDNIKIQGQSVEEHDITLIDVLKRLEIEILE